MAGFDISVAESAGKQWASAHAADIAKGIGNAVAGGSKSKQELDNALADAGVGAEIGASIGSVVPGVGTAIGGVIGGIVGGAYGVVSGAKKFKVAQWKATDAAGIAVQTVIKALNKSTNAFLATYGLDTNSPARQAYAQVGNAASPPISWEDPFGTKWTNVPLFYDEPTEPGQTAMIQLIIAKYAADSVYSLIEGGHADQVAGWVKKYIADITTTVLQTQAAIAPQVKTLGGHMPLKMSPALLAMHIDQPVSDTATTSSSDGGGGLLMIGGVLAAGGLLWIMSRKKAR